MKKLAKSFLMLSMASLAIISSCKKDDGDTDNEEVTDVTVSITPSPTGGPLTTGTILTLTIQAEGNPDNKVKEIIVTSSQANGALLSKTVSVTSLTEVIKDTIKVADVTYSYTVTVKGEKGNPATKSYSVNSIPPYGWADATPVPIDLKGQTQGISENHFMQLVNPFSPFDRSQSMFTANVTSIDLGFFYGDNNKATIASPSNLTLQSLYDSEITNWTGAKTTHFAKTGLSSGQFDAIVATESDSAIVVIASSVTTWTDIVPNLAQGNVLVYKTAEGKKGLLRVTSLTGTQPLDAVINLDAFAQD